MNQKEKKNDTLRLLQTIFDKLETMEGLIASINQLLTLSEWEIKEAIKKFLKEEKQ